MKNNLKIIFVPLLLVITLLGGCSAIQVGKDFDMQKFSSKVRAGTTTKTEILSWLGKPGSTGVNLDKDGETSEEWMYFFGTGTLPKMQDTRLKILQVRFSKNGVVNSYNWSTGKE